MYKLFFTDSIELTEEDKIYNIFSEKYKLILEEIFLSSELVEILFHKSDNGILDGEANMLQRFLVIHLSDKLNEDEFLLMLIHELFHLSHYEFFSETGDNIGTIIDEGLAIFLEDYIRTKLKLNATPQNELWKKKISESQVLELLKKARENDGIFDKYWYDLLFNNDLKNNNFVDNSIYQIGYWLVKKVANKYNMTFEDMFFKNRDFWNKEISYILESSR